MFEKMQKYIMNAILYNDRNIILNKTHLYVLKFCIFQYSIQVENYVICCFKNKQKIFDRALLLIQSFENIYIFFEKYSALFTK